MQFKTAKLYNFNCNTRLSGGRGCNLNVADWNRSILYSTKALTIDGFSFEILLKSSNSSKLNCPSYLRVSKCVNLLFNHGKQYNRSIVSVSDCFYKRF